MAKTGGILSVFEQIGKEPFRVFFPEGVLAGIVGVAQWPLYSGGVTKFYLRLAHARLMAYGLFGRFIFGFLGTAMPRMVSVLPLDPATVIVLLALPKVSGLGQMKDQSAFRPLHKPSA